MSASPIRESFALQYRFPSQVRVDAAGAGLLEWPETGGPLGHRLEAQPNASVVKVHWQPDVLTGAECEAVLAMGQSAPPLAGQLEQGPHPQRISRIAWIAPRPDNLWLFHRLALLFTQVNRAYGFDIAGFVDALQFTEYGPGQHYDWHLDTGAGQASLRKLSATVQLSAPHAYEGGALEFVGLGEMPRSRTAGSATFFPSFLAHRVAPVTTGVRRSLVAWASGAPFR